MPFSPSPSPSRSSQYAKTNDIRPGHRSIFRPPLTPSGPSDRRQSSFTPRYASGTASSSNRKRPRADSRNRASVTTPYSISSNTWTNVPSTEDSILRSECASPPPMVNTTYNLAGGLDTPSVTATDSYYDARETNDFEIRRRWRASSDAVQEMSSGSGSEIHMALGGDRNGKTRYATSATSQSWGSFMFGIVGGVAGKVWSICTTNALRGFYAGGGQGYDITPTGNEELGRSSSWEDVEISRTFDRSATPVPGQYPSETDLDVQRPAKRIHTEKGSEWVMIDSQDDSQASTPLPRANRKAPDLTANPVRPTLGSRRSLVPVSRRTSGAIPTIEMSSKIPTSTYQSPLKVTTSRPSFSHRRSASDLTPSRTYMPIKSVASPLSPETQRFMAERKREERQADASIRRLNEQLKAMIKEGKEALGTKVEVLDEMDVDMEDEGYFEQGR
ncbi:hypothetical protein E2P81_ATG03201 [Venturia nashicola]|uniref:Uncharacterized protein n=1 Tax=Venturia nashicola TaxID=86259 RepID=A0A4Z1P677_9PEZI|nr:hypothetical protein E6O75_ATG03271 [Venturia nashicola]TLD36312.1 hypothetical protein E2P81_ATG03201 [Venturia nashicola]